MSVDDKELAADLDGLLDVARTQIPEVSGYFTSAGTTWFPEGPVVDFYRSGGLPNEPSGPSDSLVRAYSLIQKLVLDTATTLDAVGTNLEAFVKDVAEHDQGVAAQLRKLGDRI